LENVLWPLDFNNGRCDVGKDDPDVRNIGFASGWRVSSRRDGFCRASCPGDFFQCDLSTGVKGGRASDRCESFQCDFPGCPDGCGRLLSGR
jgi:hypothetical protein